MEENVFNKNLVQILLNGIPLLYEGILQGLTSIETLPTFKCIVAKLINKETQIGSQKQETWQRRNIIIFAIEKNNDA